MSPELTSIIFGLITALLWGSGDFSGGIATRRTAVFNVLIVSQIVGLGLISGLVLLTGDSIPPVNAILWAGAAGIFGAVGIAALYRALAIGQMGIAAPVAAVFTAAIPVLAGMLTEGLPAPLQLAGFGVALAGVWILSRPTKRDDKDSSPRGLELALLAGVGFGMLLVGLDRAGEYGGVFSLLVAARISSIIFMTIAALVSRNRWKFERRLLPVIMLAGIFDVLGNATYVVATQQGRLDVAAVLSSLYPASTVILAGLFLKERLSRMQMAAIGLVLLAIVLITLPGA